MSKIVHFVPGGWNGESVVIAVCGKEISPFEASSLYTTCNQCKAVLKKNLKAVTDRVDYE